MPISRPIVSEFPVEEELTDEEKRRRGWTYDPVLGWQPPIKAIPPDIAAWTSGFHAGVRPRQTYIAPYTPPPSTWEKMLSTLQGEPAFYKDPMYQRLRAGIPAPVEKVGQAISQFPPIHALEKTSEIPGAELLFGGAGLLGMARKIPKKSPKAVAPEAKAPVTPSENIYLRMPIERVRQDAEKGVNLAKEALEARKGGIGKVPKPKEPWQMTKQEYLKQHPIPEDMRGTMAGQKFVQKQISDHIDIIREAARENIIPPEVLKTYPGMNLKFETSIRESKLPTPESDVFNPEKKITELTNQMSDAVMEWRKADNKFGINSPESANVRAKIRNLDGQIEKLRTDKQAAIEALDKPSMTPEIPVEPTKPPAVEPSLAKIERPEPIRIPPREPPKPPVEGGILPSGREPGGIGRQTPYTPPDPVEQLVDALTPTKLTARDRATNFIEATQRKFYDNLYVGLNELEKKTGIPGYTLARLTRGAVAAGEDNIRRFIRPILDSVSDDIQRLEQYMVLHRNMDIVGRNPSARLPGNMTAGGTIKAMESMETKLGVERFARVDQAARELWKKNDELILTRLKNAGMLDGESYTRIKSANPHYIDFGRADFDIDDVARIIKNPEASVTGTGMQRLTEGGSVRKLDEPLASSLRQFANVEVLVSRNEAAKNIILGLQKLEKQTGEKLVTLLEEGAKAERSLITDTISFLQDGKKLTYQVPRRYAISAKGLEAEAANVFSRVTQIASAPLRHGAVTYNPAFVIINPMRDALSAWFREGLIPFSPSYIRGWQAAIMKNADFTEVAQARVLMSGIVDTMRSTKAITAQAGRGALSVKSWKDALTILPRLVAEANLTAERATRIATYYKLKGRGVPELERSIRSRDVSVDFAKMGDVMKLINQAIPFTNAGLQGTLNVARTIREKPLWAIAAASPLVMTSILTWVNNKRFETSSKIPVYEQSYSWVLQVGEGVENPDPKQPFKEPEKFPIYIKVPKGPMGSALTVPVELMLRLAWATNNRSVLEELLQSGRGLATAVLPVEPSISGVLPPLLSTAMGIGTGQDVFRGQPIVPFREEQRLPEQQFGAETSTLAVELGKKFKVSPRLIDFAIKDYTAGTGQLGLWIVGMALEALGAKPEVYGEAFQKEPSPEQAMAKVPLISRFVGTKGTGEEIFDRKAFRDIADASQRNIAKFPDINRLGITFGDVGDTIAGAVLDVKQRTQYQTIAGQRAEQELFTLFNSPAYSRLSDTEKRQAIQDSLAVARERAREEIAPTLGAVSVARYDIVKRGGSIAQFEKLTGLKWDDPKAETLITGAHRYLKSYWDIENQVWRGYDPRLKQLSDMLEKLSQTDEKKAKDYLFQVPEIMWARREVLLQKRVMRQDNPTLEAILQLFY